MSRSEDSRAAVCNLLKAWSNGDQDTLEPVVSLIDDELRRLARFERRGELAINTIHTTAILPQPR